MDLERRTTKPRTWVLDIAKMIWAVPQVIVPDHTITMSEFMISHVSEIKDRNFNSQEEWIKWDGKLHLLENEFEQRYAMTFKMEFAEDKFKATMRRDCLIRDRYPRLGRKIEQLRRGSRCVCVQRLIN